MYGSWVANLGRVLAVRPDGTSPGPGERDGLAAALTTWFGPAL